MKQYHLLNRDVHLLVEDISVLQHMAIWQYLAPERRDMIKEAFFWSDPVEHTAAGRA